MTATPDLSSRELPPHSGDDVSAESHEVQQIIRSALAELPPRYRVALCAEYGGAIPTPAEPRNEPVLFRARRRLTCSAHATEAILYNHHRWTYREVVADVNRMASVAVSPFISRVCG